MIIFLEFWFPLLALTFIKDLTLYWWQKDLFPSTNVLVNLVGKFFTFKLLLSLCGYTLAYQFGVPVLLSENPWIAWQCIFWILATLLLHKIKRFLLLGTRMFCTSTCYTHVARMTPSSCYFCILFWVGFGLFLHPRYK